MGRSMRGKAIAAATLTALAVGSGVAYWFYSRTPEAIIACDEEIREDLASPSSYQRIKYQEIDERLTKEQYAAASPPPASFPSELKQLWIEAAASPVRRNILIDYEARNAFGVPVRAQHVCDYVLDDAAKQIRSTDIELRKSRVLVGRVDKLLGR